MTNFQEYLETYRDSLTFAPDQQWSEQFAEQLFERLSRTFIAPEPVVADIAIRFGSPWRWEGDGLYDMFDFTTGDIVEKACRSIGVINKPFRLECIWYWYQKGLIPFEVFNREWWSWWGNVEFPSHMPDVLEALRATDYFALEPDEEDDDEPETRPTEPLRIYRGATMGHQRGFSWTDDLETARWFAKRFSIRDSNLVLPGYVFTAIIEPQHVLGFGGREPEVIVDPEGLKNLEVHEGPLYQTA